MDTTTDAATQEEALNSAQPPAAEQPAEADTPISEPPTTDEPDGEQPPEEPATADTSEDEPDELTDEQILDWAGKKGLDLSTPEGQAKALRSFRTAEKKMHQATTQASELASKVSDDTIDPNATDAQRALHIATQLQNANVIRQWTSANKIGAAEDAALGKYAVDNPETAALLREGRITLDQFRAMAGTAPREDAAAAKAAGKKEALESIASKQGAGSVTSAATGSQPPAKVDPIATVWDD